MTRSFTKPLGTNLQAPMTRDIDPDLLKAAAQSKAWPFEEARRLEKRLTRLKVGDDKPIIFETGYGPSGLPHIGTFGEVARTSFVQHAFEVLTQGRWKTRLICFSDDLDGLRKVPTNVPNQEMLESHLEMPLSAIPNPFDSDEKSFAAHNNGQLKKFLDRFKFDYEFFSATDAYKSGVMDETLLRMLEKFDDVMNIILPTLGAERQATYSPFLPVCQRTGKVLQVPMIERNPKAGTVVYADPETGEHVETKVTGGAVKCQWKADWAMRWTALGVDYEMAGKDLIDSVNLSSKICRAIGGTPPEGFNYELFLDENAEKISKSKGNGLTIDEWLNYAPPESLSLFMFQKPKTAKRLFFDVIPKAVDEVIQFTTALSSSDLDAKKTLDNPAWHIYNGTPPADSVPVSFALLLNLVSASNAHDKDVLWGFIRRLSPDANPKSHPQLDRLTDYAVRYYDDFVKPKKQFRIATDEERTALLALGEALQNANGETSAQDLQTLVYEAGKSNGFQDNLRDWFKAIYEVLLGSSQGPRFGSFIALYGVNETRELIAKGLNGDLANQPEG